MRKIRKYLAIIILIFGIILIVPNFFNLNNYKAGISKQIYKATNYHFLIEGNIKIFFFPNVQLKISDAKLVGKLDDDVALAKFENLEIALKILPLLKKNIVIDSITINSPEINLNAQNINYIDSRSNLIKHTVTDKPASQNKYIYNISKININNAKLNYNVSREKNLILEDIILKLSTDLNNANFNISFVNNGFNFKSKLKLKSLNDIFNKNYNDLLEFDIISISKIKEPHINLVTAKLKSNLEYKDSIVNISNGSFEIEDADIDELLNHDMYVHDKNKTTLSLPKIFNNKNESSHVNYEVRNNLKASIDLDISANNTIYKSVLIEKIHSKLLLSDDHLKADISDISLNKGKIAGILSLNNVSSLKPHIHCKLSGKDINLANLLKDYKFLNQILATSKFELDLASVGSEKKEIIQNLNGDISLNISSGEITRLAPEFTKLVFMISGKEIDKIFFKDITGNIIVNNGICYNNNLEVHSDIALIKGSGDINLNNNYLNYRVTPENIFNHKNKDGTSLKISGDIKQLKYHIDIEKVIFDKILKKIDPKSKKVKNFLENNFGKALEFIK